MQTSTRTLTQTLSDLTDILTWYRQIPGEAARSNPTVRSAPSTNTEGRLPFGLDARIDLLDDGPTGIRTAAGTNEYLRILASWMWTSEWPSTTPDQSNPGGWMRTMLETPYPWETWDDWASFSEDLRTARNVVARLTGNTADRAGSCPRCGGTLLAAMGPDGRSDTLVCSNCRASYEGAEWQQSWQKAMQTCYDPSIYVTRQQLLAIWEGTFADSDLKNWTKRRHIIRRPDQTIRLAAANLWIAEHRATAVA